MLGAALAVLLLIQTPVNDPTVAVILADRTVIVTKSEAEAWRSVIHPERDRALHVALTITLGTMAEHKVCDERLTAQERERFRWHRRALQGAYCPRGPTPVVLR